MSVFFILLFLKIKHGQTPDKIRMFNLSKKNSDADFYLENCLLDFIQINAKTSSNCRRISSYSWNCWRIPENLYDWNVRILDIFLTRSYKFWTKINILFSQGGGQNLLLTLTLTHRIAGAHRIFPSLKIFSFGNIDFDNAKFLGVHINNKAEND